VDKELKILSVNGVDEKRIIQHYFSANHVPFEGAIGISDSKALERYKFGPCPMTILIGPDRKIAYVHVGFDEATTYRMFVSELEKLGLK